MNNRAILYELKIRLTSSWLGNKSTRENVRRFTRDKSNNIAVDLAQWSWTFKQAAAALHMPDVDVECIRPGSNIDPPKLVLYKRNYSFNKKQQSEMFEAMRENTVLTIQILVTDGTINNKTNEFKRAPTEEELNKIFKFTGSFLGLSPWGCLYGYGRFEIESLTAL